jgi:hypothetical protein
MEFTTSLEQELRMLGVLPPAMEMKIDNEPDGQLIDERYLYLDKNYYNMPNLDEYGQPDF